jgi:hypothetical protein
MARQAPWAKLWLLYTANSLTSDGSKLEDTVKSWARTQLSDKHEVVRAEAAWYVAGHASLSMGEISHLFMSATSISRPAIAAALARQKEPDHSPFARAIIGESLLVAKGFAWGAMN